MYAAYWNVHDQEPFQRLVADFLPLALSSKSGRAGTLYGVGTAARVLFDKAPEELTLAQQALFAAAIKKQLFLGPDDDLKVQKGAATIFARIKQRAEYGLRKAYDDDSVAHRAINELRAMALPQPMVCPDLEVFLPEDPVARFRVQFNPAVRAQYFAAQELTQAINELRQVAGDHFRERVAAITLSISSRDNVPFKWAVEAHLAAITARLRPGLSVSLVAATTTEATIADVLFAAADHAGNLRFFYQAAQRPLLGTPRATGSVSKLLAAMLLATQGTPDDHYCNRRIDGMLRNANGDTGKPNCRVPGAFYTAEQTFARSLNLPLWHALRTVGENKMRSVLAAADFKPFPATPSRTAIAFGMADAAPDAMLRAMTALSRGVSGERAIAEGNRIVATIAWRPGAERPARMPTVVTDLSAYFKSERTAHYMAKVLSAPLKRGGTAASLSRCNAQAHWSLAKTGTVTVNGRLNAKLIVASSLVQSEALSFIAVIGHPIPAASLGKGIRTGDLAGALCAGVRASFHHGAEG